MEPVGGKIEKDSVAAEYFKIARSNLTKIWRIFLNGTLQEA